MIKTNHIFSDKARLSLIFQSIHGPDIPVSQEMKKKRLAFFKKNNNKSKAQPSLRWLTRPQQTDRL